MPPPASGHRDQGVAEGRPRDERRGVAGALPGSEGEPGDVDERDDVAGVRGDPRHDGPAVGVADQHDRPVEGPDQVGQQGGVGRQAPQRVRERDHAALGGQPVEQAVPARRLGIGSVHEHDRGRHLGPLLQGVRAWRGATEPSPGGPRSREEAGHDLGHLLGLVLDEEVAGVQPRPATSPGPGPPDVEDVAVEPRQRAPRAPQGQERALDVPPPAVRVVVLAVDAGSGAVVLADRLDGARGRRAAPR